jgi:cyclopropane-fatty-acyl-phospholipid synthase
MSDPTVPDHAPGGPATAAARGSHRPPGPIARLLDAAGVQVDGNAPWDLRLHDPAAWQRMLRQGVLGVGESYMDGQWDSPRLDEMVCRLLRTDADRQVSARGLPRWLAQVLRHTLVNLQSVSRAFSVAERHYDLGNDLFAAMLDSRMVYSCAYWARAGDLETAQLDKLELICRKLELQRGEQLLDVGCGWGGLAEHAARVHGCRVVGATVSHEQAQGARERCAGLPVDIRLTDWRALDGRYDKLVSVGMFEHVGPKNYRAYFERLRGLLGPEGLFLLHTIGADRTERATNAWTDRYIFPNGKLPSAQEIARASEGLFVIEDWHNFGPDYDRTCMAWWERFERAWPALRERAQGRYDERFYRMWKFYLLSSAGFFRSRQGQLWQIVLAPRQRSRGYRSVR